MFEQPDDPTNPIFRCGADSATTDLPMLVWLRGDEPWCADFSLDAGEVMQQLGIKRSRLTQISGRELRVGRIRKGRYISPVYRAQDVQEYIDWTRATATHQKASHVLNDAAVQLEESSRELIDRLEASHRALINEFQKNSLISTQQILSSYHAYAAQKEQHESLEKNQLDLRLSHMERMIHGLREESLKSTKTLTELGSFLQLTYNEMLQISATLRVFREDVLSFQEKHENQIQALDLKYSKESEKLSLLFTASPKSRALFQLKRLNRETRRNSPEISRRKLCQKNNIGMQQSDLSKNPSRSSGLRKRSKKTSMRRPSQPK